MGEKRDTDVIAVPRAEQLLLGAANALRALIASVDSEHGIQEALRIAGEAADVDRAYVFARHRSPDTALDDLFSQLYEWAHGGVEPQIGNPDLQNLSLAQAGFQRWVDELIAGRPIKGLVADLPASERPMLRDQGIQSLICVPLVVDNETWGFVGFDDCRRERAWSTAEEAALMALASGMGADIMRRRNERQRIESEERLRRLSTATNEGVIIHEDGIVCDANDRVAQMVGLERAEDLIGTDATKLVTDETRPTLLLNMRAGYEKPYEVQVRRADGSVFTAEINGRTIVNDGRPLRVVAVRDLTEHKAAEEELRQSREMLQLVMDTIPQYVFWKDREGRFLGCNRNVATVAGFDRAEDLIGKTDYDMPWSKEQSDFYRECDRRVMENNAPEYQILEEQTQVDGRRAVLMTNKVPLHDADGNVVGILGTFEDITDRREIEEQLRQAQKMEAVGQLAGGIAHDFNNLMTAVIGYAQLLQQMPEAEPFMDELSEIQNAGQRAADLTRQLLAFSRRQIIEPRVIAINDLIATTDRMLRRLIREDIELHTNLADDLGSVRVDHGQLEQVLINLVVNASDAMPTGGVLTIETSNTQLDEEYANHHADVAEGDYILLAVSDTGTGMTDDVKEHIFEPFFTTKDVGHGTGLGLATCYGIVKQAGGHINVYSVPSRGSTFKVYLPRVDERAEEPHVYDTSSIGMPTGDETILLVEDEPQVRQFAGRILREQGYRVLEATNGREAVDRAAAHEGPIHLLLTDVVMPQMGGMELVQNLRVDHPDLRVLYTSGYTDNAITNTGLLDAAVAYLQKPFNTGTIARKVRDVLDA